MGLRSYRVEIPDEYYFQRLVSCRTACPVGTNAGGYAALIGAGRFAEAYAEARRPNPLASICGRICAHPCESACRRKSIDAPVSIRALKRFVTSRYGVEAPHPTDIRAILAHPGLVAGESGKHVAVIGAGPAGLSCAHDLALLGHSVTVFEAASVPGGMLYLGVPEYRLPRDLLLQEIAFIEELGVKIMLQTSIGVDVTFEDLVRDHDAVFIGAGCMKGRGLNIEGNDLDGVLKAVDFLLNVNLGYRVDLGENVLVIGGGNVAFDAARSAARYGGTSVEDEEDHHAMLDVARLALRSGAREVTLVSLEREQDLPADPEEVEAGREEGIRVIAGRGPRRIMGKEGRAVGLETVDVASVFDEQGRFAPTFIEDSEKLIAADTIIMAVGQEADLSFLGETHGLEMNERGHLLLDRESCATSRAGVYAGGDIAFGPRIAIEAVSDGKRAAAAIHRHMGFGLSSSEAVEIRSFESQRFPPGGKSRREQERVPREEPQLLPVTRRIGVTEVECAYEEQDACLEGVRCLHCWIAPVFDSVRCVQCGGCIDVCPELCLKLVDASKLEASAEIVSLLNARYGNDHPEGGAIIKDEEACLRCGLCAKRCPVEAIEMQSFTCRGDPIND